MKITLILAVLCNVAAAGSPEAANGDRGKLPPPSVQERRHMHK